MIQIWMILKLKELNCKKSRFKINLDFFNMFALTKRQFMIKYNKRKNAYLVKMSKKNRPYWTKGAKKDVRKQNKKSKRNIQ